MNGEGKKKIAEIMERHGVLVGYLFGSAARGTMGPHSDIDVGVIFGKEVSKNDYFNYKISLSENIRYVLGLNHVDIVDISSANPFLKHQIILSEGKIIYSPDPDIAAELASLTLHEYEDAKHLRAVSYEAIAGRVAHLQSN